MGADRSEQNDAEHMLAAGASGRDSSTPIEHLEQLVETLELADVAFRSGAADVREQVLSDGLSAIGALYGALDVERSPETTAHLEAVYDACLRALGDAYGGDVEALSAAATMVRAIRSAICSAESGPRSAKLRRAA